MKIDLTQINLNEDLPFYFQVDQEDINYLTKLHIITLADLFSAYEKGLLNPNFKGRAEILRDLYLNEEISSLPLLNEVVELYEYAPFSFDFNLKIHAILRNIGLNKTERYALKCYAEDHHDEIENKTILELLQAFAKDDEYHEELEWEASVQKTDRVSTIRATHNLIVFSEIFTNCLAKKEAQGMKF